MSAVDLRELLDSYLAIDGVLILLALLSWWLLYRFVFTRITPYPEQLRRPFTAKLGSGVVSGIACLLAVVLLIWVGGGYGTPQVIAFSYPMEASSANATLLWSFFALQSLFEELLFRALGIGLLALLLFWMTGVLFMPTEIHARQVFVRHLWFYSGLAANIVVAFAFAAVHAQNPHFTLLAQLNIALAGLVLGQLFWLQGAPWASWGWHWVWNAGMASLGLPVSGVLLAPALTGIGFNATRDGFWSGGAFGPEGSIACSIVLALYFYWLLRATARLLKADTGKRQQAQPEATPADND
jgi:hypothetical protein